MGTLAPDTMEFESSPRSLLARTPVVTSGNVKVDTSVYETVPSGPTTFGGTLDWTMRVDEVDAPNGGAVLAQFALIDAAGGGEYDLQLVTTSHGAAPLTVQLAEDFFDQDASTGNPFDNAVSSVIPLGMWTHFSLSMTVPAAGGQGTATLVVGTQPTTISFQTTVQNIQPTIGIGVLWASTPSSGWQVAYDDAFFDSTSH
jgi:hypothetical protein